MRDKDAAVEGGACIPCLSRRSFSTKVCNMSGISDPGLSRRALGLARRAFSTKVLRRVGA